MDPGSKSHAMLQRVTYDNCPRLFLLLVPLDSSESRVCGRDAQYQQSAVGSDANN